MSNNNDLYNRLSGMNSFIVHDPFTDMRSEQARRYHEAQAMKAMAYQEMAMAQQKPASAPIPNPEPNKVLLLLGEDA